MLCNSSNFHPLNRGLHLVMQELSLLDDRFLDYSYSTVAAACLVLAEFLALGNITNFRLSTRDLLAEYITLDSVALKDCVSYVHELYQQALAGALPVLFAVAKRFPKLDQH